MAKLLPDIEYFQSPSSVQPLPSIEDIQAFLNAAASDNFDALNKYLTQYSSHIDVEFFYPSPETALIKAVYCKKLETVKFLVAHGADVNAAVGNGHTPLMTAAVNGYVEIAEFLLEKGALIDQMNFENETALDWARKGIHPDTRDSTIALLQKWQEKKERRQQEQRLAQQLKEIDFSRGLKKPMSLPPTPFKR
jgi:ankyrin repeat protein